MAMNATDVKEESEAALERLCARAARMCGPDIKEIVLKIYPVERCNRPAFSLAPLAQFADLGALRVYGENRWFHSVRMLDSEHVLSLASLSKLSRLDLKGLSISPAAVAALHELPLAAFAASFYCSDFADDTDDEDEEAAYRGDRYVPAAEAAVSAVVTAFPGLQRLLLYMALCAEVVEACNVNVPPSVLRPLASLASLRSLSLSFDDDAGLQSVAPIAALSRLEHLALEAGFIENMQQLSSMTALRSLHLQDTHRRGTLASEELSSLARLPQLEALRVQLSEQGGVDLSSLFGLAPRLRLLSFEIDKEDLWLEDLNSVGRRIAKTLLRFTALEHVWLDLPEPCALALSRHSLAPWSGVRTLGLGGHDPSADLVRRIAFDMTSLRELVLGGSLPLPLPADVAAAFRGRLRRVRMRANVEQVQSTGDAATTDELRARLAELEGAIGVAVEPLP
eukprot:tig00001067_g6778.t1